MLGKGKGKYEQEDRSRDWYCPNCSERNFLKRAECFKCKTAKPKDGGTGPPAVPATGTTMDGMIKSYNRKGFGFIMCIGGSAQCQDIYYSRESLHPALQTRDIPGEHITFEIQRFPDGKLVAKNVRPRGDASGFKSDDPRPVPKFPIIGGKGPAGFPAFAGFKGGGIMGAKGGCMPAPFKGGGREEEDRSRDWLCEKCNERNFVKRHECFKCQAPRPRPEVEPNSAGSRRTFSPHAGSRAVREALAGRGGSQRSEESSRSRSRGRVKKNKKKKKASSGSSSSTSRAKKKRKKAKRKRKDSSSEGDSSKSDSSSSESRKSAKSENADEAKSSAPDGKEKEEAQPKNPEVEKAKAEALERLMKLRSVEPKEARMKEWRELLRQWHPDKNPDRTEVATAVFQFLQKAKPMVDTN